MEFVINRDVFLSLLTKAAGMVPSSDTQPILKNFHLRVGSSIQVMSTDMIVGAIAEVPTQPIDNCIYINGETCVPAAKLIDVTKTAPDGYMRLVLKGQELTINGGYDPTSNSYKCEWVIHTMDPASFPDFPSYDETTAISCNREELYSKLDTVSFAAAENELKASLMAIYINNGFMYAADGQRACRAKFSGNWSDVMLPAPSIKLLVKLLKSSQVPEVSLCRQPHHYVLKVSNDYYHVRMLEESFPDVEGRVFAPTDKYTYNLVVKQRKKLLDAVKRAAVTSEESNQLTLKIEGSVFSISTRNVMDDRYVEVIENFEWNGQPFERLVNYEHLEEALSVLDGDDVIIRMGEETNTQRTRYRVDEGDFSVVLLPLTMKRKGDHVHRRIEKRADAAAAQSVMNEEPTA